MKRSALIISTICLLLVVGIALFFWWQTKEKKVVLPKLETKLHFARLLSSLWTTPPDPKELTACAKLKRNVPLRYYQCNVDYLKCALTQRKNYKGQEFKGSVVKLKPLIVEFSSIDHSFKYKLDPNCHMAYLPKKIYSAGLAVNQELLWDNFHEQVYIDKYYVTNQQVSQWKGQDLKSDPHLASLDLEIEEKKGYCADQGKTLLQSRYLDAASFLPLKAPSSKIFFKPVTHFKKGRSFIENRDELNLKNCSSAYIKGCEEILPFENYKNFAQSWMGINYVLGGRPETVENKYAPMFNLKLSSMYLPIEHPAHRIGYRSSAEKVKGAFRCMLRL